MPRVDPYKNSVFLLEIDGITQGGFSECSGFGSNVQVIEYREGGDAETVRKMRGMVSYPDITLRWGLTDSRELYDWHLSAVAGQLQRKNLSIVQLDDRRQERVRWNCFGAWPSRWDAPDFNAKGNDVSIDALTISCERVERA